MITGVRVSAISSLIFIALAACEEGQGLPGFGGPSSDEPGETASAEPQVIIKDVDRPDIFDVTELALWDGRPSLGGVWVAHPDVKEPERAMITNQTNGQSIPGALFRRERDNPGPRFQVSSEAAAALNMLAGQPTEIKVLVVRQEEVIIEPEPLPVSEEDVTEPPEDIAEPQTAAATLDDLPADGEAEAEAPKRRGNFLERLFGIPPKTETEPLSAEGTVETSTDASAPGVETSTLDPVTTGAAAAIARAEADDKPQPRPSRAAQPAPQSLKNPYVQVGLFSVEENASAAAANLRQSGILPTVLLSDSSGSMQWRVVIGPVTTADDQAALLAQVKRLGYNDAFLTPE